ncbi:Minor extracellular protease vpr 10 [Colletotrichum chlorophyti]|uniref:Minor extracellular protease vpr 10 n=1 Tax=Colletotrichum chlorophyti TaxID=708187 RepID=A0A1Q8RFG8_9PEZI|nr:Minor extracellular protease vpr 10 [Colletotrichum chlorophyti]
MARWHSAARLALLAAAATPILAQDGGFVNGRTALSPEEAGIVPGRYIIELEPAGQGHRARDESGIEAVVQDLNTLGHEASVKEDFSGVSGRFNGASVELAHGNDTNIIDEIKAIPGVANVWPVHHISLNVTFEVTSSSPDWSPHTFAHAKEVHDRGLKGAGQRVCVVDSGVDVNHPALKGKIAGGKNLVDDTESLEDCSGHGTFVSSVIVADHQDFHGVAPDAEVYLYKIFGCSTGTTSDLVIKGILAADADDCDIINLSLGSNTGYRNAVTARVASQVAQDRLVVIAAGNDGAFGPYYASSPAVAPGALPVGSVEADQTIAWPAVILSSSGDALNISYVTPDGTKLDETIEVPLDLDIGDSCNIQGTSSSEDAAVLARRGVCIGRSQAQAAEWSGYSYALAFDTYDQGVYYETDVAEYYWGPLKLFGVTASSVGQWAADQVAAGNTLSLIINAGATSVSLDAADVPSAGHVSEFSSWGPSFENDLSPLVSGPGGMVYGAFPDSQYAVASGTSFSSPYVAGVAALYYAHVKKNKDEFIRRITSTSQALPAFNSAEGRVIAALGPVAQQGAGLINVANVFDHDIVLLSEPVLHLNDTDNRINTHTIRIQNNGDEEVVFNITHVPASTVLAKTSTGYIRPYYPPLSDTVGSLEAPETFVVAAGSVGEVQVTFASPDLANDSGALWSGKVVLQGSNNQAISLPYIGIETSTYNWGALHHGPEVYRYDSSNGELYPVDAWGVPYRPVEGDSPEIWFAFRYGTYEFSVDLVGEDWTTDQFTYPPKAGVGSDAWYGPIRHQPVAEWEPTDFPMREVVRFSQGSYVTFRYLANGTEIPSGRYRVFSRSLRIFGDATNPDDWQLFLSDPFPVQLGDDPVPGSNSTTTSSVPSSTAVQPTSITTDEPEVTSSTAVSSSAPSASVTDDAISVPGPTTTLSAPKSKPTGLEDVITALTVSRMKETSPLIPDPGAWLEIRIQFSMPNPVPENSVIQFGIPPELVDVASGAYLYAPAAQGGSTAYDAETGLFTISLTQWTTWNKNMVGDFYVMCRFEPEFAARLQPGTYVIEFPIAGGKTVTSTVYHAAIDRTAVYERLSVLDYLDDFLFSADIEVPAALGPWDWVGLEAQLTDDDGFICDQSGIYVGRASCGDKRLRNLTDVTDAARDLCSVKQYRSRYTGAIGASEALRFTISGIQGDRSRWTYAFIYALDVHLSNGTTVLYDYKTLNFEKNARTRSVNFNHIEGERAVPLPS